MESCGMKCLKWLMFIFNFLFFVGGCVLLALGIWVVVDGSSFMQLFGVGNSYYFSAAYLFIAVGVALIIISFFGFCGAIKENRCMLGTFFFIVLIIFILEVVGAILAFVYYPLVEQQVVLTMRAFNNNSNDETRAITDAWNLIQETVNCCGFNSTKNWVDYGPFPMSVNGTSNAIVPMSCCVDISSEAMRSACLNTEGNFHTIGCENRLQSYYWVIGGVGIGVLVVELLAMIFACCLFKAAGKDDNYA